MQNNTPQPNTQPQAQTLTPDAFKARIVAKYPNGVASDGTPYAKMDAGALTRMVVNAHPNGVTNDGHKYADFLPKEAPEQPQQQEQAPRLGDPGEVLGTVKGMLVDPILHPVDKLLKPAAQFVNSVVHAPVDAVRAVAGKGGLLGLNSPFGSNPLPSTDPSLPTYQEQVDKQIVPDVMAGRTSPAMGTAQAVIPPVATGAGIIGAGDLTGIGKVSLPEAASGNFVGRGTAQEVGEALANRSATKTAANAVAPRLTPKVAEESATTKSGLLGKIERVPTQQENDMAGAVKGIVKGKSFSEDKELVKKAISDEANTLKKNIKAVDHPVPKREMISALRQADVPDLVASDATLNGALNRTLNRAAKIVNDSDGTVGGMLDARKAFDKAIEEQYPDLYSNDRLTPIKSAIKNVRKAWNDYLSSQLPDDVGFKDSLRKQTDMYNAVDNLSEKAARGAPSTQGEIGTNRFERYAAKNPVKTGLIKKAAKGALYLGGGAAIGKGVWDVTHGQ